MLVRSARTPFAKHCSRATRTLAPRSLSTIPTTTAWRSQDDDSAGLAQRHRRFSSLPHHLARKNNGMVNVLVKSTKVPRPVIPMVVPKPKNNVVVKPNRTKNRRSRKVVARDDTTALLSHNRRNKEEEEEHVPSHFSYAGNAEMPITSELRIVMPDEDTPGGTWPTFRMMDESGNFRRADAARHVNSTKIAPAKNDLSELRSALTLQHPHFAEHFSSSGLLRRSANDYVDMTPCQSDNTLLRAHRQMIRLRNMDTILQGAQRQGRISFYMTHRGEEAIHMGSASALAPADVIFAQYREAGLLMWRGFTLEQFCDQCFANDMDLGKGRQMPVHYGSRALNYQTVSSPLGTQITQAVGAAYKFKLENEARSNREKERTVSIVYFGDGAASTVDFHSACNFAATLKTPMIFFCRNNGYAISTPVEDQYAGDGIVSRAPGYGMAGVRVDGNDAFAVHAAVARARRVALETSAPVMIEAMTYRQGHHSTSDDSSRYRDADEVQTAADASDPLLRLDRFLKHVGWMDEGDVKRVEDEERVAVLRAMEAAEARPEPRLDTMFEDVYHEKPPHLIRQEEELRAHVEKYNISHR